MKFTSRVLKCNGDLHKGGPPEGGGGGSCGYGCDGGGDDGAPREMLGDNLPHIVMPK
jgi:hypothetical protein